MDELIYLDNAASTMKKPAAVVDAITEALTSFGGPGRGGHPAAIASTMALFKARSSIAELVHAPSAIQVALTSNITESLNIVVEGLVKPGDHLITTMASHNSVLRPLYRKERQGATLTIVKIDEQGQLDLDGIKAALNPSEENKGHFYYSTGLVDFTDAEKENIKAPARVESPDVKDPQTWVVVTHSSNLTGDVYDIKKIAEIAHAAGAKIIVDAAQTAGVVDIDMQDADLDIVCMTGHKSLYGPQGTGALALKEEIVIPAYKVGGSGMHSYDHEHPDFMPEALEAGTANAHGAAGLAAGVGYVLGETPAKIREHIDACIARFEGGIKDNPKVKIYGGSGINNAANPEGVANPMGRCGISAINIADVDSSEVSDALANNYNICTRPGAHCAPLMHEALGTVEQGVVRFGFCSFTTFDEVDAAITAINEIANSLN